MSEQQGVSLDIAVHHELGHAVVGLDSGLVVNGIELTPVGDGWGGLTHLPTDVAPEQVRAFLIALAAGDQAASVFCAQNGEPRVITDHGDRQQYAEVLAWVARWDTGPLPTFEEASAEALRVVHRLWGRITTLAPKLAGEKNLLRSELMA